MTDIKLQQDISDQIDLAMDGVDLLTDEGLETAIIISLFSDTRVSPAELPEGHSDRRGWWGDVVDLQDPIGSKLWTLAREKTVNSVIVRAEEYAAEALQWMIDDGVVTDAAVNASFLRRDTVLIEVDLRRREGENVSLRFEYNWQQQIAEAA